MAIIDKIYDAVDDFGMITSAEARELGLSNAELVQQSRRGKLVRVARGVYRMPVWPQQEAAPYALAVKAAGAGARLSGESVVSLLKLAPTDPSRMYVSVSGRNRRNLGKGVRITPCAADAPVAYYEGVACQPAADAIRQAARTMGPSRAANAAREALGQGYITKAELEDILRELES